MIRLLPLILLLVMSCAHTSRQDQFIPPREVQSRLELAEKYLLEAEPRMAMEQLRIVRHSAKNNPTLYFFQGVAYELLNDLESSIMSYERAVDLHPDYGEAWNNLGQVRQAAGEYEAAQAAYERALALDDYMTPEFAAYNMASLMAEQGKLDMALAYSRLGLEKNRRYTPLYQQSADLLRTTGRLEEAVEVLEMGVLARPDSLRLRIMLAEELIRLGRENEARKWFAGIIENAPDSSEAETAAHYLEVLK